MEEILKEFVTKVQEINGTKTVTYCHPTYSHFSGVCIYEEIVIKGKNKPLVQRVYVLVSTDMGDVIEYIHKKSPLSSEDLMGMNKLIRDHSLSIVSGHH